MSPAGSRKRPAPGASPTVQQPQATATITNGAPPQLATDQLLQWHQQNMVNSASRYPDTTGNFSATLYDGMNQSPAVPSAASNQLARRQMSQQLAQRAPYNRASDDGWPIISEDGMQPPQDQGWLNSNDDLEQKAQIARRDTQAKRKQIPPFVQKLSR